MYKVIEKEILNPTVTKMVVEAPAVAKKALAGQFIILRVHEDGERIPLTIADYDREKGTITIIFQIVGKTTMLLNQLNVPDDVFPLALLYLRIYLAGLPVILLYNFEAAVFRSVGETKIPLIALTASGVLNVILNLFFVAALHMSVDGVAIATVLSQAVSAVWVMLFITSKKCVLRLKLRNLRVQPRLVAPCILLGLSPFVMQSTESVLSVCFNASLLKYGGDIAVGAMTILASVMQFAMLPLQGLTQGSQPIVSYNFGAGNVGRVRKAFRLLLIACVSYSTLLWLVCMLFPQWLAGAFSSDAALIAYTVPALRIYMACSLLFGLQIACQQTFIAIGNAKTSLFLAVLRKLLLLIPLIYILPALLEDKTTAVYLAEPVADTLAVITTVTMFSFQFRRALKQMEVPK